METDVLSTNKVLASRGISRDLELELWHAPGTPGIFGKITVLVAKGLFPNLEPFTIAFILLDITGRCLGHDYDHRDD
jgi:hypothetical protein